MSLFLFIARYLLCYVVWYTREDIIWVVWWSYKWKNKNKSEELLFYVDDEEAERIIISKKYKFIKFLVDYDKIGIPSLIWRFDEYETVLCNLAISYTPIETLISYLR